MYTDLATVTIFTTGSSYLPHKNENLRFIIPKVFETKNSVFRVQHEPEYKQKFDQFQINSWRSTNINNQENSSKNILHPSKIRPFGKWYEALFKNTKIEYVTYGGVFAVSRAHVHHRSQKMYKELLDHFPEHSNPEVGHYFERAWLAIFHPVPKKCIFLEHENPAPTNVRHVGGSTRKKRRAK